MALLPFGEWRPDVSDYQGQHSQTLSNVLPRGDGYGPFKDYEAYSAALPAACRGAFFARKSDGSVVIFAGTSDRLYKLNNTDVSWVPVSKVAAVTSISNASPAVVTYTAHGFAANDPVVFTTDGALPAPLAAGTVYYVKTVTSADTFTISATAGGAAIDTTDAGSGTHSVTALYSALSSTAQWQFAQFNNYVFAVQANVVPQVFDLSSSSQFATLGGSPPQAAFVAIVNRFVVLSGLLSNPYRVHWSGLNATTTWTSGTSQSDFQDLADGGIVRGVGGGEYGIITQDGALRRMIYAPGSPVIFQIERIAEGKGILAPYSLTRAGDRLFYLSSEGLQMMVPTGYPEPIGKERVDRTLIADLDASNIQLCIGAADPKHSRIFIAYKSISGATGLFDKLLCYDWAINRFTIVSNMGEYLSPFAQPGVTLENLDSISSSIDALSVSLDDISTASLPEIAAFNSSHKLGFYRGDNLQAAMETGEQGELGRRVFVRGIYPLTDADEVYGSLKHRANANDTPSETTETAINAQGFCPQRKDTCLARAVVRIPAAETWTFATGVKPLFAVTGER